MLFAKSFSMQNTLALLEEVFGHQKKGVKYLRRLLCSRKPCPIVYVFSQQHHKALDFGRFVLSLASQREISKRLESRRLDFGQNFLYQNLTSLNPRTFEDHLLMFHKGFKIVAICENYPWLVFDSQDEKLAFLEIKEFDLQLVLDELDVFADLLLKKIGFDGKPNSEFTLGL
jgi:hypothetical protein